MIERILVPLDGSELAQSILPVVEDLATRLQAEVYLIQVVGMEPGTTVTGVSAVDFINPEVLVEDLETLVLAAESYLSSLASEWQGKGIRAKWEVVREIVGRAPGVGIIEFAASHDVDLIAMSTHGRSGLSRLLFGSVAEQVVRDSGRPVLLIKPHQKTTKGL